MEPIGVSEKRVVKKKQHTCYICNKSFSSEQSMTHHMLVHTGEKHVYIWYVVRKTMGQKSKVALEININIKINDKET